MNAERISRIVSLIPERTARAQTGTAFTAEETQMARHCERFAHLMQYLNWLTPLTVLTKDDQRILGLLGANGRPAHSADEEEEDLVEDAEADASAYVVEDEAAGVPGQFLEDEAQEEATLY
jgi:hypothetical protein